MRGSALRRIFFSPSAILKWGTIAGLAAILWVAVAQAQTLLPVHDEQAASFTPRPPDLPFSKIFDLAFDAVEPASCGNS